MAAAKSKDTKIEPTAPVAVEPPAVKRGRRGLELPDDIATAYAELIDAGSAASDNVAYEEKGKAQSIASKYRKALVHSSVTDYTEVGELRTRVWEDEGAFRWAIVARPSSEGEG